MPVTSMFRPIRAVPTSVPFTYRDGITTLELIELLRRNVDILQCDLGKLEEATTDFSASVDKALADTVAQLDKDMADLRAEMLSLIHEMERQGVATSPVYGTTQPLGDVLGGMYDNSRNHGLFWGDYDGMRLTAQEYDALSLKAREYDLKATAVDNCVPGDFPGRSQFPYGKSMPENPVADMSFITQSEADARYVERNPSVSNFETSEVRV